MKNTNMKKHISTFLIILCGLEFALAQSGGFSAVRLNSTAEVVNTIFWGNTHFPASSGVVLRHSASDSLPVGSTNLHLLSTPFVGSGHQINFSSPVYNAGNASYLRSSDTLDLSHSARVSCDSVDIGAYEFLVSATKITRQPQDIAACQGTLAQLTVVADGDALSYQWQRLVGGSWINLSGNPSNSFLIFTGSGEQSGDYRVIVHGACCTDTSAVATVRFDVNPATVLSVRDTVIVSGESVDLSDLLVSSVGTVIWYEDDRQTVVLNSLISDITQTRQYVVVVQNGSCPGEASAAVWLTVNGTRCLIKTGSDTTLCHGDSYRLLLDSALVEYTWMNLTTMSTVPDFALVRPDTTTRFVAFGENSMGHQCSDTLTIFVHKVAFEVVGDTAVCGDNDGIYLWSIPAATNWFLSNGVSVIGSGNLVVSVPSNQTTTFIAMRNDGTCEVRKPVSIHSNPPDLRATFSDTTICEGSSLLLSTNVDPSRIKWHERLLSSDAPGSGPEIPYDWETQVGPVITRGSGTYIFEAWDWDDRCGDVYDAIVVTVQAKPAFHITTPSEVAQDSNVILMASPNATFWTLLDGTRVFNPITVTSDQTYVGWLNDGVCLVSDTINITATVTLLEIMTESGSGCFVGDGWAMVQVISGTPPYTYLWSSGATTALVEDLQPGTHSVTVTDGSGATQTKSETIASASELQITFTTKEPDNEECIGGDILVDVSGGTLPYYFEWQSIWEEGVFSHAQNLTHVKAGVYDLLVVDNKGCEKEIAIPLSCVYKRVMPTLFITPNGDGYNDFLIIQHIELYPKNKVTIITSYGEEITTIDNYNNRDRFWDGKNRKGQQLPDGVYYYIIVAEGVQPMAGDLLMRLSKRK